MITADRKALIGITELTLVTKCYQVSPSGIAYDFS
jgi:hypothetical protein